MRQRIKIAIIAAVKEEIKEIRKNMRILRKEKRDHCLFISGLYYTQEIIIVISGIGKDNVVTALNLLIEKDHPQLIISCGFAAGLKKELNPADLVISNRINRFKNGSIAEEKYFPDSSLLKKIVSAAEKAGLNLFSGSTLTSERTIFSSLKKKELNKEYKHLLSLDMESGYLIRTCLEQNIPFLNLRTIFDGLSEDITFLDNFFHPRRGFSLRKIIFFVFSNPKAISKLLKFKKKSFQGAVSLNILLKNFCRAL